MTSYMADAHNILLLQAHLDDVIDLYTLVLNKAIAEQSLAHLPEGPYERYYIASIAEFQWKDIIAALAKVLYERGFIRTTEPVSLTADAAGPYGLYATHNFSSVR